MQPQPGNHFNQQQLQPFGSSGSNSAHTSPMKRAPQAVSPLASPMESRRVFMAHQQAMAEQQGQPQHQAMGISALQLGYAVPAPACRLLIDPQTGQQYFVPTAAHPLATPPAATAYFQPALFYNQPSAFYQPHHQHQHSHSAASTVTSTIGNSPPGTYLFPTSNRTLPTHTTSDTFYTQSSPTSNAAAATFYTSSSEAAHRSQSPMGRESIVAGGALPYRVEVPPSTVDDGDSIYRCGSDADRDTRGGGYGHQRHQEPPHFQRLEQCRLSTESRGSSTRSGGIYEGHHRQHQPEINNPEEEEYSHGYRHHHNAHSPPPLLQHRQVPPQFNKPMPPLLQLNQNALNHHSPASQQMSLSIGGNGSSSESTSGIASGCRSRTRTFGDEPRSPPPPQSPLREQRMLASFPTLREEQQRNRSPPLPAPPARRAIRMDIDLSRPMSPPENASTTRPIGGSVFGGGKQSTRNGGDNSASSVSVRATVLRTIPPTAFTISFNDESTQLGQVSISETSLQDAARQAPKGRRLMLNRRSVPPRGGQSQSQQQQDSGSECGGDPKRWLFRKMLQGRDEEKVTGRQGSIEQPQRAGEDDGDGDNDADHEDLASEAGTYVVDKNAAAAAAMTISQISTQRQLDSDSNKSSSSSSSSSTSTPTNSSRTASPGPKTAPKIRPSFPPANQTITSGNVVNVKRSLMGDLRRLRENANSQPNPSPIMTPTTNSTGGMPKTSSTVPKLPPPIPAQRKIQQPLPTPITALASSGPPNRPCRVSSGQQQQQQAFRPQSSRCRSEPRNDGGRFSMRPSQHQQRPLPGLLKSGGSGGRGPVPMRQQSANAAALSTKAQQPVQKSPEMLNWLRRKEYDPRKAAATTTITDQQKTNKAQSSIAPLAYAESTTSAENEEAFMANRSLSAVPSVSGATVTKLSVVKESPFARWRSATQGGGGRGNDRSASVNRSHDDLSRLGGAESLDEESLLGAAPDSCTSSLKRTVDELTQKCHKSIQSIINNSRLNQSTLSPSVEQLLERVAQSGAADDVLAGTIGPTNRQATSATIMAMPSSLERNKAGGGDSEDISDRLDRLNSAFDAIQKYLEEQTPSGRGGGKKLGTSTTSTVKNENIGSKFNE